jgi:hypothetical protein
LIITGIELPKLIMIPKVNKGYSRVDGANPTKRLSAIKVSPSFVGLVLAQLSFPSLRRLI